MKWRNVHHQFNTWCFIDSHETRVAIYSRSTLAHHWCIFKNKDVRPEDLLKGRAEKQNPSICNHCINRNQSLEHCFIIWRLRVIHDKLRSLPDSDIAYISYALVIPITREEFTRWLPSATQNTWVQQEELINKREEKKIQYFVFVSFQTATLAEERVCGH